jgi:hypothetical protein
MSLPYLKDVLVSLYEDVVVSMKDMSSSHYPSDITRSNGTSSPATCWAYYDLAPVTTYGTTQRAVWSDFQVSFFKVLSLMHLTLLMLDFEIAKMIHLGKRRHAGPCEECVQK